MMSRVYPVVARHFASSPPLGNTTIHALRTQQRNLAKRSLSRQNARKLERQISDQNIKDNTTNLWSEKVLERQLSAKKRVILTRKKTMKQYVVGEKSVNQLKDRLPDGTSAHFSGIGSFLTLLGAVGILSNTRVEDARHTIDKIFRFQGDPKKRAGYSGYWRLQTDPESAAQFAQGGTSGELSQEPSDPNLYEKPHLRYEWVPVA